MSCNIKVALLAAVLLERVVLPATGSSQQALLPAAARSAVDRWIQSLPVP